MAMMSETASQARRHRLMHGVIERIARTSTDFVLRGGYLTRAWVAPLPRPTQDLDFVGDFAFDIAGTVARFDAALACPLDDGIVIESSAGGGIWLGTALPGVHVVLADGGVEPGRR